MLYLLFSCFNENFTSKMITGILYKHIHLGLWQSQFKTTYTWKGDFLLANGDTVKADFMGQVNLSTPKHASSSPGPIYL